MNKCVERLHNGIIKENPTFVLMLGMCPTLAVTSSAMNGLGMGLTTAAVLIMSNAMISLLRKVIPDKVRIPAFIVVVASFVTMIQFLLQAFIPALYDSLGIYIPLIVVNCIILGRAESYAYTNKVVPSIFDGLGMGLGFTVALTCIGLVREMLGAHKAFGVSFAELAAMIGAGESVITWLENQRPIAIFVMAPGAFFVLAALTAIQNVIRDRKEKKGEKTKIQSGCSHDCLHCGEASSCEHKFYDPDGEDCAVGVKGSVKEDKKNSKADKEVQE